ncbi:MAG: hypothetical protein ABIQ53_05300 [Terracoccus sp.]
MAVGTAVVLTGGLLVTPMAQASPATTTSKTSAAAAGPHRCSHCCPWRHRSRGGADGKPPSDSTGIRPGTKTPKLVWGSCGSTLEQFRCGTVAVPTDYDTPRGATTTIALIKRSSRAPRPAGTRPADRTRRRSATVLPSGLARRGSHRGCSGADGVAAVGPALEGQLLSRET